ncbi:enoyl-CoA hydratase/isomerase family protein [Chloroflexota bacterium]
MPYQAITYQTADRVGIITLNRPEVGNAINIQLAMEMANVCSQINHDQGVSVVTITGAGEVFSVGTDWGSLSAISGGELQTQAPWGREKELWSVATAVSKLSCPVIAAINGDALGQGLELALACDCRIAAETARLGLPQISSNHSPWDGGTQRLPRLVGRAKAMEMILLGEPISAREAYRLGLVNKVIQPEELSSFVPDMARRIASNAPLALRYAKEAVHKGLDLTLEQGLHLETDLYMLLQTTEDRTEGITSFLQKRQSNFKGR